MNTVEIIAISAILLGELALFVVWFRRMERKFQKQLLSIEYYNRPLLTFERGGHMSLLDDMNNDTDVARFYGNRFVDDTVDEGVTRPMFVDQLDPMDLNSYAGFMNGEIDLDANPDMSIAAGVIVSEEMKRLRDGKK